MEVVGNTRLSSDYIYLIIGVKFKYLIMSVFYGVPGVPRAKMERLAGD